MSSNYINEYISIKKKWKRENMKTWNRENHEFVKTWKRDGVTTWKHEKGWNWWRVKLNNLYHRVVVSKVIVFLTLQRVERAHATNVTRWQHDNVTRWQRDKVTTWSRESNENVKTWNRENHENVKAWKVTLTGQVNMECPSGHRIRLFLIINTHHV